MTPYPKRFRVVEMSDGGTFNDFEWRTDGNYRLDLVIIAGMPHVRASANGRYTEFLNLAHAVRWQPHPESL
jgi:hypothetical protein